MDYPARVRQELETRCTWLRTKAAYLHLPEEGAVENPFDTAIWWCLKTGYALGPDGATACPGPCDAPGRPCYEAPPRI